MYFFKLFDCLTYQRDTVQLHRFILIILNFLIDIALTLKSELISIKSLMFIYNKICDFIFK
jgi:hypothetical protein